MSARRRTWIVAAGVALAAAAGAPAQPGGEIGALAAELAGHERRTADGALPIAEREAAQDAAIEVRRRLLAALPATDERREPVALRQAAALLDVLWRDGASLAVLYGVPIYDQRARVLAAAGEAERVLGEFGDQGASLRVAALALAAAASEDEGARRPMIDEALSVAARARERGTPVAGRVEAAAVLLRGRPADAERALRLFEDLLEGRGDAESGAVVAERWFGLVRAAAAVGPEAFDKAMGRFARAREGEPFVREGKADPLLTLLAADVATAALIERWRSGREAALLERAVAEQAALLERDDLGVPRETVRALVHEKLAAAIDPSMPLDELPPIATLARAVTVARRPETRGEAIGLLERLAARPDAGPYAPEALWELAVVLSPSPSPEDRVRAVAALTRLAREFPSHARAGEALRAALAYGRSLAGSAAEPLRQGARAAYLGALEVATEGGLPVENAPAWKLERARLLLEEQPDGAAVEGALSLLESIGPGSEVAAAADALYVGTLERMIEQGRDAVRSARARGEEAAVLAAARALLPVARRGAAWAERRPGAAADRFLFAYAEALTESGSPDGERLYRALLERGAAVGGGAPALRLGLARSMLLAGRRPEAFGLLRELTAELEGVSPRPPEFWHGWTLMLEMLAADNADGARTGTIRTHARRLGTLDPELGGEPWRTRIGRAAGGR